MAVRVRQPPPALRLVRPYFVRISSARVTNTQLSALIRLGWVAISNGKEGAGAHDPTPPALHIIHVITAELNRVFTVDGATLSDPELEPFRNEIMVWYINRREVQALTCP